MELYSLQIVSYIDSVCSYSTLEAYVCHIPCLFFWWSHDDKYIYTDASSKREVGKRSFGEGCRTTPLSAQRRHVISLQSPASTCQFLPWQQSYLQNKYYLDTVMCELWAQLIRVKQLRLLGYERLILYRWAPEYFLGVYCTMGTAHWDGAIDVHIHSRDLHAPVDPVIPSDGIR
jgi:hypothetical protein